MMQCIHCWVPVKKRPTGGRTWGKGEDEDDKVWVHDGTINAGGNPVCNRTFLSDDEVEEAEVDSDSDEEA